MITLPKKTEISKNMLYGIVFLFGRFKKKARYLHRYPENNLFTLKKTNTY